VNYLYGRNLTPPKDDDRKKALELAKAKKRAFDIGGEKEKEKCAQQIINKLTPVGKAVEVESVSKKGTGRTSKTKTSRGEYMELIKKIRGKSSKEIFEDMEEDLTQLANIRQKIKDGERKKIRYLLWISNAILPKHIYTLRSDVLTCPPPISTSKFK